MTTNYFNSVVQSTSHATASHCPLRRTIRRFAMGLSMAIVTLGMANNATAETIVLDPDLVLVFWEKHDDGTTSAVWVDANSPKAQHWYGHKSDGVWTIHKTDPVVVGNPNPEGDDYPEPGDMSSRIALAKQKGGKAKRATAFETTPVGEYMTDSGKGLGVVWNPSDDEGEGESSAPQGTNGDPKKVNDEHLDMLIAQLKGMANGDVNDFQINGDSIATQVKGVIRQGEIGDQGDPDASVPGWFKAAIVGPLLDEIHNPNPEDDYGQSFLLMSPQQMAVAAPVNTAPNSGSPAPAGTFSFGAFGSPISVPTAPRPTATVLRAGR